MIPGLRVLMLSMLLDGLGKVVSIERHKRPPELCLNVMMLGDAILVLTCH